MDMYYRGSEKDNIVVYTATFVIPFCLKYVL